jgi:hypothetical protein
MRTKEEAITLMQALVRRRRVVEQDALCAVLGTQSPMTVYRRLKEVGYHSSFSHRGRYYTLTGVPKFDDRGLWFHRDIGFSQAGTLKETVARQVDAAPEGQTHAELQYLLRVRVHNTLHELVHEGRIGQALWQRLSLYLSARSQRAAEQLAGRQQADRNLAEALRKLTTEETVDVLVEVLRAAPAVPAPAFVAQSSALRERAITVRHVEQVYESYGLVPGKKTLGSTRLPR